MVDKHFLATVEFCVLHWHFAKQLLGCLLVVFGFVWICATEYAFGMPLGGVFIAENNNLLRWDVVASLGRVSEAVIS